MSAGLTLPRPHDLSSVRSQTIAMLDVGSAKICCLIARLTPAPAATQLSGRSHTIDIIGIGQQRAQGVRRGAIVDMELAERSIRLAVNHAERMAGVTVESVIVSFGAGRLSGEIFDARVAIEDGAVRDSDIARVIRAGRTYSIGPDRMAMHSLPTGYAIDGEPGIIEPRGMVGQELGIEMHVVTAQPAPLRNLIMCIERSHLSVEAVVASPFASALSSLVADEMELGTACIDMGAGTTSFAIFAGGSFVGCGSATVGGHHITMDLARGLSTTIDAAERIKTLYGSAIGGGADFHDTIAVPHMDDPSGRDIHNQVPRSFVCDIIRPRVEEILEVTRDKIKASGVEARAGRRAVLVGGASQMPGMGEMAERILGCQVRAGRPLGVAGLPESARGPAYSAAAGLAVYPQIAHIEQHELPGSNRGSGAGGYLARVGNWIREGF
ncbi:MAG: cell division protein FtsA [Flavobacteriaceae bacterium]